MSTRAPSNAQRSQSAKVHGYVNRQLDKTRRQVKSTELITHLLVVMIFVVGFLQLMALVDAWVWSFNSVGRWLSFIFLVGAAVGYLFFTVCPLLLRKIHPDYAAKMIEEIQPTFKNSLLNYVSLRKQPEATHAAVMDAVTKQAAIDLQTVPEDATVDRSSIIRIGFYLLGLIAFVAFYWMLSPKDPLQSFSRILLPSAKKSAPSIVHVTDVSPGDKGVFFGDPVVVSATIKGQFSPEDVQLVYSTVDGQVIDQIVPMQPQTTSSNRYEATLTTGQGGVQRGLVYKVIARDGASPDYEIVVHPNPSITLTAVEITPPEYTLLPQETISGQGTIEAVEGSLIKVNAVANLPIKLAYVELLVKSPKDNTDFVVVESVSMIANEMEAHGEFHAIYNYQTLKQRATHFRLKFLSTEDDANQNANVHAMRVIADLAPQIEVLNPIQNSIRLPINETLLIDVRATDTDYGISSIELEMQNNGTNLFRKQKLPLQSEDGKKRVRGQFQFTPEKHYVRVGETVLFTATASDNRTSYLSGSLDPNQTMTRQYQIEIVDAVENPKRPAQSDPKDGEENPGKKDPSEQGDEGESKNGESGESGENGSSSDSGDASDQGESGDAGDSSDQGESGDAGESGDEGGDPSDSGDSASESQQGGDQGEPGSQQGDSSDGAGGEAMEGSGSEGSGSESSGSEGSGSESGGESGAQSKPSGDGGSEENGSQGNNTQGSESQNPSQAGNANGSDDQNAGSDFASQDKMGGSKDEGGAEGARKPLSGDAADGDVMSRMEEIMKKEKSKQGDAAGQQPNGQDQKPAQQNTGSGTDPNQENPRQSEGTGSMQQDDYQPPKDAQGGENNAQRGDGNSSSSQGEENGTAKGSSGNETGDQSNEGASSKDSQTGQSDETGGNDPVNAASESSQENQQKSGESGNGESGKAGQSSEQGAKPSQEAGEGSGGQQKSGGDKAGESGEQGGGEQGGGEQGGGEQGGGEQGGGEQGGGEQGGGEQGGGEQGGGEQGGGEQGGGEGATGEGQSGGPQKPSDSGSTPGKAGGSKGSGPGGETIAEKENAEHSKKATDMVLKRLEEERFEPDPKLLEELNWSKEDLNQFLDRWQQMKAAAGTGDPIAKQRYKKALKSLGLSSDARQKKVRGVSDKQEGFNTDSAVNRPPQEIAPGYRAFKRARNRSKN